MKAPSEIEALLRSSEDFVDTEYPQLPDRIRDAVKGSIVVRAAIAEAPLLTGTEKLPPERRLEIWKQAVRELVREVSEAF